MKTIVALKTYSPFEAVDFYTFEEKNAAKSFVADVEKRMKRMGIKMDWAIGSLPDIPEGGFLDGRSLEKSLNKKTKKGSKKQ